MAPHAPSQGDLIRAYRHLYRGLLHAVQFSAPARYIARDQLRYAFRREHPSSFDPQKISRTIEFLDGATKEAGMEHKLLKNLLQVAHVKSKEKLRGESETAKQLHETVYAHYNMTLAMLNDSMGLCLR